MNKTLKISILISSFVISLIISGMTTPVAKASFMDWVGGAQTDGVTMKSSLGFGLAYLKSSDASTSDETIDSTAPQAIEATNAVPAPKTAQKVLKTLKQYSVTISGYSSTPDQTDDSPFITASNTYVREGIIATNFLPFKTKVQFPDTFPGKTFVVEDRMNTRYNPENSGQYNIDIWFADRGTALQFGRKHGMAMIVVAEQ